jgi:coproporphyrinogen III oxidase-like Fe-S oxidoreductase
MPWSVYGTRVERLITEEFTNKLRKTGMERLSLGVESFSSRVQKEMGKSSRYDDADRMCKMFANAGIKTESWIIYGYPNRNR